MPAHSNFKKGSWTAEEDEQLRQVLHSMPKSDGANCRWSEVSMMIPGRSAKQCRERWCYNLDPTIKKSPWTTREDELLIKAQQELGNRWAQIALQLPGRTENSVKTRHKSIMRAKKRAWTKEEDALILSMHSQIGCRWDKIAERLPLRTKNAVKTRYRLIVRGLTDAQPVVGSPEQVLGKVKLSGPQPTNVLPAPAPTPTPAPAPAPAPRPFQPQQQQPQQRPGSHQYAPLPQQLQPAPRSAPLPLPLPQPVEHSAPAPLTVQCQSPTASSVSTEATPRFHAAPEPLTMSPMGKKRSAQGAALESRTPFFFDDDEDLLIDTKRIKAEPTTTSSSVMPTVPAPAPAPEPLKWHEQDDDHVLASFMDPVDLFAFDEPQPQAQTQYSTPAQQQPTPYSNGYAQYSAAPAPAPAPVPAGPCSSANAQAMIEARAKDLDAFQSWNAEPGFSAAMHSHNVDMLNLFEMTA